MVNLIRFVAIPLRLLRHRAQLELEIEGPEKKAGMIWLCFIDFCTEVYETQPNHSRLLLGSFYLQLELRTVAKQPQWYRDEANQINHGKDLRELLTAASRQWPEAFGLLGVASSNGIGGAKNREEATGYFKQGIGRDDPSSMYNYAQLLREGQP